MPNLRYIDDEGFARTIELASERLLFGREASCDVRIDRDSVSREHAIILRRPDGEFMLRDLGSRNKTHVNGQPVSEMLLTAGDVLRIGECLIEFLDDIPARIGDLEFLTPDKREPNGSQWVRSTDAVALTAEQIQRISGAADSSGILVRSSDIAERCLSHVLLDLKADRGFIALRGKGKRELSLIAQRGLNGPGPDHRVPVSETFVFTSILQDVAGSYPAQASQISAKSGFAATAVIAPFSHGGSPVGVIYVDRPVTKRPFSTSALIQLIAIGALLGTRMNSATAALSAFAEREAAASIAGLRRLQNFVQSPLPQTPGFDAAARCLGGTIRCGDLYDIWQPSHSKLAVVLTDGGGRGVHGLSQAGNLCAAVRTAMAVGSPAGSYDLGAIVTAANQALCSQARVETMPACVLLIDGASRKLQYVNAAMPTPLLMRSIGALQSLDRSSLLLGVDREYSYEASAADLPRDSRVILLSDGVTECCDAQGRLMGDERVRSRLLQEDGFNTAGRMLSIIAEEVDRHAGKARDDDATALVIACA